MFPPRLLLCLLLTAPAFAQITTHLLQRPALGKSKIVFSYAGDLWSVDRSGGHAERLTTGIGIETDPVFSPDESTIAFTGEYDGNTDVFTIPAAGGVPQRLTYHPAADYAVAWTPDGKNVIFRSNRNSSSPRYTQLFEVPLEGGLAKALPLPMAFSGQFSHDGKHLAYMPISGASPFDYARYTAWRNYRGGLASYIAITRLSDLSTVKLPRDTSNDFDPAWVGNTVYFLSDRNGPVTLFRYEPGSKSVTECFKNTGPDIRSMSAGPGGLVYDQFGQLFLYDTAAGKSKQIDVEITADMPEVRSHLSNVSREIRYSRISPTGVRAVFEAHGEILTVPAQHGDVRNITNTPGVMERQPAWSPDGQRIAYFSDESGQYALHIRSQNGEGEVQKFPLATSATFYSNPLWSPDSKLLTFRDNKLGVLLLDTTTGKWTVFDKHVFDENESDAAWSPDSRWLAYTRSLPNHLRGLFLYSVADGNTRQVSDGASDIRYPAFDPDGHSLYFTESTNYGGTVSGLDMSSDVYQVTRSVYALVLASNGPSPIAPESDEEKKLEPKESTAKDTPKGAPKPVRIDFDHLLDRAVPLPIPPANYQQLATGKTGVLYLLEAGSGNLDNGSRSVQKFDLKTRKVEKLGDNIRAFDLSADGEKMLIELGRAPGTGAELAGPVAPVFAIVPANAPIKAGEGLLKLNAMEVRLDPQAEWRQMYHEVWQIERSYFYDPHFHGVDTFSAEEKFQPYLASIAARSDLNYLFQEMLGPFSVGHLRGAGGAIPTANKVMGGLLGADFEIDHGRYQIKKIFTGEHWNPQVRAPLAQPGLKVQEGNFILAVNGENLRGSDDISRLLEGTAGKSVVLTVASDAAGGESHEVSVVPVSQENTLRNLAWIESNRQRVNQLSNGKLGYVYLPDTAAGGFTNFNRYYFSQLDKQGIVVDERFNSGGQAADYIIDVMKRQLMSWWTPRYGAIYKTPEAAILGPKSMLTNEFSGSGGDAMPWFFREAALGPLVGKRTWGGLVGIGGYPDLMDGGTVTSPRFAFFSPTGQWEIENHGVAPDVEVDMDPKLVSEGHDPQLEKAVSLTLEALAKNPVPQPKRPDYPNYNRQTNTPPKRSLPTGSL